MAGRTRLTGGGDVDTTSSSANTELYSPGFALPSEPHVASPWRNRIILLVVVAVLTGGLFGTYRIVTSGQDFDPALTDQPGSPAPDPADG